MEDIKLAKKQMLAALELLNLKLAEAGDTGELVMFGGAVMCLVYGARLYTRDIDAVFEPKSSIYELASQVAAELNLPKDWLNDGVKGWLHTQPPTELLIKHSNLVVYTAAADYILAMKCYSSRELTHDREDALFLVNHLGLKTADEVLDLVEKYVPRKYLEFRNTAFVYSLFGG